jgi:hypothetical protein
MAIVQISVLVVCLGSRFYLNQSFLILVLLCDEIVTPCS